MRLNKKRFRKGIDFIEDGEFEEFGSGLGFELDD